MRERVFYFDNAKFILIFLVVFGHFLRSFTDENDMIYTIYKVIYTFHMPAFILVSGYFAKGYYKKGYIKKIAMKLIIPYLIFQLIYSVFYYFLLNKSTFEVDPLTPHWSLWFLISVFFWNIMLWQFAKFKAVYAISAALILGLCIGYFDWANNFLSISRTFVFFPLFLIGYFLKKDHFRQLFKKQVRVLSMLIFVLVFVWFWLYPDINYEWLLGSKPYAQMGAESYLAVLTRLGFYILSIIMCFSFLSLVPKRKLFFTRLGKNTLYVYLLHGFFIRFFRESDIQNYFSNTESMLIIAIASLLLTLLLSSKLVTSFAQPIIELSTSRLRNLKLRIEK